MGARLTHIRGGAVGLVSISDRIDLSTPPGRAMAQMGAVFAQLRALIGQRTSEARAELRAQGRGCGPTLQAIADGLDADGVPTAQGGLWRPGTIAVVLRYAGCSVGHAA